MGNVHARQYRKRSDVELFFYDHNPGRAERFQSNWQAEMVDGFDQLVSRVDIVDICLPTPAHHSFGLKTIAAGRALFLEKPVARTLDQAREVVEAAEKANVPFMPGHVLRFFPEYARGCAVVKEGGIGTAQAAARTRRGGGGA